MLELLNQTRSPEDIHINVRHSKTYLSTSAERERERETEGWMCLKSQSGNVYSLRDDVKAINTKQLC